MITLVFMQWWRRVEYLKKTSLQACYASEESGRILQRDERGCLWSDWVPSAAEKQHWDIPQYGGPELQMGVWMWVSLSVSSPLYLHGEHYRAAACDVTGCETSATSLLYSISFIRLHGKKALELTKYYSINCHCSTVTMLIKLSSYVTWSTSETLEPLYNGHFGTSHFRVIFAVI